MESDLNSSDQVRADELEGRLINFAVRIIKLSASIATNPCWKTHFGTNSRAGTAPDSNYGEARGAESPAHFVHKLRIVLKELNETSIWLRIIERSEVLAARSLLKIMQESKDLCRIFTASLKTARARQK